MPRTITAQEMERRKLMAHAKEALTSAMHGLSLTALEWIYVLHEMTARMIGHGLVEEFEEDERESS